MDDDNGNAFRVLQGANQYFTADTTDGGELVTVGNTGLAALTASLLAQGTNGQVQVISNIATLIQVDGAGPITLDSDATVGATQEFKIADNTASSWVVKQSTFEYINIDSSNGTEKLTLKEPIIGAQVDLYNSSSTSIIDMTAVQINVGASGTAEVQIGNATSSKIGFYDISPIVQPNSVGEATGFTAGSGTGVNDDSTFTGNVGSKAYRINDIVKHLKNLGIIADS